MKIKKIIALCGLVQIITASVVFNSSVTAYAQVKDYGNGVLFDAEFYAKEYPDVFEAFGNDEEALYNHYIQFGIKEGRKAYEGQVISKDKVTAGNQTTDQTADETQSGQAEPTEGDNQEAEEQEETEEKEYSKGLVLVYLNGSDLETESGYAHKAVNQMIEASKNGNTRFVVLAGGTKKWHHPAMQKANNGSSISYVIENGEIRELCDYNNKKEFLSSETLSQFIYDTTSWYGAEHTSMIFWDHGGGVTGGYGSNEITDKGMTVPEVVDGIKDSGVTFESVGFDTCLMGSLEVASSFSNLATYFVGSQEVESGHGWNFKSFENYGTTDFQTFGKKLIDDYDEYNKTTDDDKAFLRTLSMYSIPKLDKAQKEWDNLLVSLGKSKEGVVALANARNYTREFNEGNTADNRNGGVDLIDLLTALNTPESKAMIETVKQAVLYKNNNKQDGVNGISAYLPGENVYIYNDKYENIKSTLSDSAMETFDKLESIYCGQRDSVLFSNTKRDQKHDDDYDYSDQDWYNKEYASIGVKGNYSYNEVKNGGFALKCEEGFTMPQIEQSEMRVILKDNKLGYVSLGRVNTFCRTADLKNPVFNFNGQWIHINGMPVAVYQYGEFELKGKKYIDMYTFANVNGKECKLNIQWNATDKEYSYDGYIPADATIDGKTKYKGFVNGDEIQFVYDTTKDGKKRTTSTLFDSFIYDEDNYNIETKAINQPGDDVMFHGTITDAYGKTISTPYFKVGDNGNQVTVENVKGSEIEAVKSEEDNNEDWTFEDDNSSFLSCYYNPDSDSYESYDGETKAYNMILVESRDVIHFSENIGVGFFYDAGQNQFYLMDPNGNIDDESGSDAAGFAASLAKNDDEFNKYLEIFEYISSIKSSDDLHIEIQALENLYKEFDDIFSGLTNQSSEDASTQDSSAGENTASNAAGAAASSDGSDSDDTDIYYDEEDDTYYYYDEDTDEIYEYDPDTGETYEIDDDDDDEYEEDEDDNG